MIYHIYFEFEVMQLLQMLSHIKRLREKDRWICVVCYSADGMADTVNQGMLFFLANC